MQNLMVDYYEETDNVHRLHDALCKVYCAYIRTAHDWFAPDGWLTSDDLGHQSGPMVSPGLFRKLIVPYYKRIGEVLDDCRQYSNHRPGL